MLFFLDLARLESHSTFRCVVSPRDLLRTSVAQIEDSRETLRSGKAAFIFERDILSSGGDDFVHWAVMTEQIHNLLQFESPTFN